MGLNGKLKMANLSYTANSSSGFQTAIWTVKLVFLLMGAVSTAIAFKVAVIPCASYLVSSTIPALWVFITSLLFPPYIYIVFNFIFVITVAASTTTFNHRPHHQHQHHPQIVVPENLQPSTRSLSTQSLARLQLESKKSPSDDDVWQEIAGDRKPIESSESPEIRSCSYRRTEDDDEEAATGSGPEEGEAMAMQQQGDTMEEVWKAITEKNKPARQLKKCDTWDTPRSAAVADEDEGVHSAAAEAAPERRSGVKEKSMRRWETFKFNGGRGGGGRVISREVSPSLDELNRRVEAFIAKITNQMKLQRQQESDQHNYYLQERMVVNP